MLFWTIVVVAIVTTVAAAVLPLVAYRIAYRRGKRAGDMQGRKDGIAIGKECGERALLSEFARILTVEEITRAEEGSSEFDFAFRSSRQEGNGKTKSAEKIVRLQPYGYDNLRRLSQAKENLWLPEELEPDYQPDFSASGTRRRY